MAAGGEQGCSLASDPELQSQLRQLWKEWLEAQGAARSTARATATPPSAACYAGGRW